MSSTILQLSSFNTEIKASNCEWTNTINKPILINTGDIISVKTAILDSRRINTTNIYIQDTLLSIKFIYYMPYNYFIDINQDGNISSTNMFYFPNPEQSAGTFMPHFDGKPWVLYRVQGEWTSIPDKGRYFTLTKILELVEGEINIQLNEGFYTPAYLAEIISQNLQKTNVNTVTNSLFPEGDTSDNRKYWSQEATNPLLINISNIKNNQTDSSNVYYAFINPIWMGQTNSLSNLSNIQYFMPYEIDNTDSTIQDDLYVGATEMSLEYNQNNIFQWTYTFSALLSQDLKPIIRNLFYLDRNSAYDVDIPLSSPNFLTNIQKSQSGVIFTSLEPADFWTNLGFNLNSNDISNRIELPIILKDNIKIPNANTELFITEGLFSTSNLIYNKYYNSVSNSVLFDGTEYTDLEKGLYQINEVALENTITLNAYQQYKSIDQYGFYLLEIILGNTNEFYSDDMHKGNISSILTLNYQTIGEFINVFQTQSVNYINKGLPFNLSSCKCRIVNPKTNETISDFFLGSNNTIILEIIRNNQIENKK